MGWLILKQGPNPSKVSIRNPIKSWPYSTKSRELSSRSVSVLLFYISVPWTPLCRRRQFRDSRIIFRPFKPHHAISLIWTDHRPSNTGFGVWDLPQISSTRAKFGTLGLNWDHFYTLLGLLVVIFIEMPHNQRLQWPIFSSEFLPKF